MKSLLIATSVLILAFVYPSNSRAQGPVQASVTLDEEIERPLFRKGSSILNLIPNVRYSAIKSGDMPELTTNDFNMNLRGNYYLWDNFGIVAGVHMNNQTIKQEGLDDQKTSLFLFEAGAQYGRYVGGIPLSAEVTVGVGNYEVFGNDAFTLAYNLNFSSYFNIGSGGAYIQPFVGYAGFSNNFKESDFTNKTNGLVGGVTLSKPIGGCQDLICGFDEEDMDFGPYSKGTNRLQFIQDGVLGVGTNSREWSGGGMSKDGVFGYNINITDYQYVTNNLGVGLGVELQGKSTSDKNSDYKTSSLDFYATPRVRYHVPVQGPLNGFFAEGGVLFGAMTSKVPATQNDDGIIKSSTFGWNLGVGYDVFFTDHFSVTGFFDYLDKTHTDKDTSEETWEKGTRFQLGIAYTF